MEFETVAAEKVHGLKDQDNENLRKEKLYFANWKTGRKSVRQFVSVLHVRKDIDMELLKKMSTDTADTGPNNPTGNYSLSLNNAEKKQSRNSTEQLESRKYKEKEQKEEKSHTTITNQDLGLIEEFISLRAVPVVVSNDRVRMIVNGLLDDASIKTNINSDVAEQLKLK